jgi:hypothetical protein
VAELDTPRRIASGNPAHTLLIATCSISVATQRWGYPRCSRQPWLCGAPLASRLWLSMTSEDEVWLTEAADFRRLRKRAIRGYGR